MATKITKTPKTSTTSKTSKAKTMPSAATKPAAGWPKDRVKAAFVEKGEEAATALAEKLGITPGRMGRWFKEWPTKGITPKAATGTTKKKNGKPTGRPVEKVTKNGRQSVTEKQVKAS